MNISYVHVLLSLYSSIAWRDGSFYQDSVHVCLVICPACHPSHARARTAVAVAGAGAGAARPRGDRNRLVLALVENPVNMLRPLV